MRCTAATLAGVREYMSVMSAVATSSAGIRKGAIEYAATFAAVGRSGSAFYSLHEVAAISTVGGSAVVRRHTRSEFRIESHAICIVAASEESMTIRVVELVAVCCQS